MSIGGRFNGQLSLRGVDRLLNAKDAINVFDNAHNTINGFVNSDFSRNSLIRLTIPPDGAQRIISIGYQSLENINKYIEKGRYTLLK